jgi:hypothetical protein
MVHVQAMALDGTQEQLRHVVTIQRVGVLPFFVEGGFLPSQWRHFSSYVSRM